MLSTNTIKTLSLNKNTLNTLEEECTTNKIYLVESNIIILSSFSPLQLGENTNKSILYRYIALDKINISARDDTLLTKHHICTYIS